MDTIFDISFGVLLYEHYTQHLKWKFEKDEMHDTIINTYSLIYALYLNNLIRRKSKNRNLETLVNKMARTLPTTQNRLKI